MLTKPRTYQSPLNVTTLVGIACLLVNGSTPDWSMIYARCVIDGMAFASNAVYICLNVCNIYAEDLPTR